MQTLIDTFANSTATFLSEEVVGEADDAYGDPIQQTEWVAGHEDVPVRYQDSRDFETTKSGDETIRRPVIYLPGDVAQEYAAGDRVHIVYRGETMRKRMASLDYHTMNFGDEGYAMAELQDYGDDTGN